MIGRFAYYGRTVSTVAKISMILYGTRTVTLSYSTHTQYWTSMMGMSPEYEYVRVSDRGLQATS